MARAPTGAAQRCGRPHTEADGSASCVPSTDDPTADRSMTPPRGMIERRTAHSIRIGRIESELDFTKL